MTTTPYHVKIAPTAKRDILALPAKLQKQIIKFVEALSVNPRPPGVEKIDGMTGLYSQDINHMRLIYKVEEQELLLLLVKYSNHGTGSV